MNLPEHPIYIVSKGRFNNCITAKFFIRDNVNFKIVCEPQEAEKYSANYGQERILILPFSNLGMGSTPARNFIWEHSISIGAKRHWIFDDNIDEMRRLNKGKRIPINSNIAIKMIEDFTDRYENIGISGFNYSMFVMNHTKYPFVVNVHVYSAMLILNEMPYRWRLKYNEDTDLCLQVLTNRLCTVLFNAVSVRKRATMTTPGGNTTELYKEDGRLKMARSLEKMWPQYVTTVWKFKRPQHSVKWLKFFKHPLIRRKDINFDNIKPNNYRMKLTVQSKIKSKSLQKFFHENASATV